MNVTQQLMLQKHREKIVKDLEANDILDELYSQRVLNADDVDKIRAEKERSYRVRCLLDIIIQRQDNAYPIFVEVLNKEYSWLATELMTPIGCANELEYEEQLYHDALTLGNVPQLPLHYVSRDAELAKLKESLKKLKRGEYVVLYGMTGSGKSVLAISAIRDQKLLKDCFNNRVYFINAGEARKEIDVANVLYRLGKIVDDHFHTDVFRTTSFDMQGINLMKDELKKIFLKPEFKEALIILDDVSNESIINGLNFGCKTLVTTQQVNIVPKEGTTAIELNQGFSERESFELFSKCTDIQTGRLPNEARQIHNLCKGLPMAIDLIGSDMEPYKKEMNMDRWKHYVRMTIDNKDGRRKDPERSKDYIANTIKHCLEGLPKNYRNDYKKFVLFVEDVNITTRALEVVLNKTKYEVEDTVTELKNKSLLVCAYNNNLQCYVCGIHDLLLAHLKKQLTEQEIVEMHRSLLKNYLKVANNSYANLPNDNYIYTYIGHHLLEARMLDEFPTVYFDLNFIGAKIKTAGLADLIGDFKRYRKYITKNCDPELTKRLEAFESFVQKYGQDLYGYPHTDIIQCGLQQPTDSEVYQAALKVALKSCDTNLYLQTQCVGQPIYVTYTLDLNEDVCAACFAHVTECILVGTSSGEIQLWDHSYKSILKSFQGHMKKIIQIQVAETFKKFLSVSEDGLVKVWSLENACLTHSGKTFDETPSPRIRQDSWLNLLTKENGAMDESQSFYLNNDLLISASFSHTDDKYIVTGSQKGVVIVWDIDKHERKCEIRHNTTKDKVVTCCTFSYNDKLILFACENLIFIYDLERTEYLSHFVNDSKTHSLLVISNWDSKIVAVSDKSLSICHWEEQLQEGGSVILEKPDKIVLDIRKNSKYICATVTWDGLYLVAGCSDHNITMWDIEKRQKVKEITKLSGGLVMYLDSFLDVESNSNVMYILLSGTNDRSVKQWHINPLENHNHQKTKLSLNFTTHWLNDQTPLIAAVNLDNKIQIFSGPALISEIEPNQSNQPNQPVNPPKCVTFSPCGNELAIGLSNGLVQVYTYRSKKETRVMNLEDEISYLEYVQHSTTILLVASSVNGCLMVHTNGKSIRLKDKNNTKRKTIIIKSFLLHTANHMLSVQDDGGMKSWEIEGINDVLVVSHSDAKVTMAAITPKQDKIALTLTDGSFKVYTIKQEPQTECNKSLVTCTFNHDKKLDPGGKPLSSCCFSNDGRILAIGKDSGDIVLWNVKEMTELSCLRLHNSKVNNLVFSPPPAAGAPFVLISIADQIAWWNLSYICDKNAEQQRRRSGRRSRGSTSRPENLLDLNLSESFGQLSLLTDSVWTGKCGREARPDLLSVIKLAGEYAVKISISPTFTSFVTVDSSGLMYIMNVLKPNGKHNVS